MPGGKCVFNDIWITNSNYKDWLLPNNISRFKAECSLCKKVIDISNMGETAVKSHLNSKKHKNLQVIRENKESSIKNYFSEPKHAPAPTAEFGVNKVCSNGNATVKSETLNSTISRNEHLKAEILWSLKVMSSNYSYKSCENVSTIFKMMFPDSQIAAKFTCAERKCAYLSVFGIAPYFARLLKEKAKLADGYVLLFDETMNSTIQSKQLDYYVRFWDGAEIASRYFSSDFLGHATAVILFEKISNKCLELGSKNLLQLSMDGPNVNWSVFDKMCEHLRQEDIHLINVGSCGLHVMHNAFRAGCLVFPEVENAASSLYRLFKDSPARRDDYCAISENVKFPLKFCKHRWLENVPVLTRLLDILPTLKAFVSNVDKKQISNPNNKSYETIKCSLQDALL